MICTRLTQRVQVSLVTPEGGGGGKLAQNTNRINNTVHFLKVHRYK